MNLFIYTAGEGGIGEGYSSMPPRREIGAGLFTYAAEREDR